MDQTFKDKMKSTKPRKSNIDSVVKTDSSADMDFNDVEEDKDLQRQQIAYINFNRINEILDSNNFASSINAGIKPPAEDDLRSNFSSRSRNDLNKTDMGIDANLVP